MKKMDKFIIVFALLALFSVVLFYLHHKEVKKLKNEYLLAKQDYHRSMECSIKRQNLLLDQISNLKNDNYTLNDKFKLIKENYDELLHHNKNKNKEINNLKKNIENIGIDLNMINVVSHQYKIGQNIYFSYNNKIYQGIIKSFIINCEMKDLYSTDYVIKCKKKEYLINEDDIYLDEKLAHFFLNN